MGHYSVLIKPASSYCNIRCKYCFYANVSSLREVKSYGNMSKQTTEKMIESIFKDLKSGDYLTIAFQGGEPTLAGLSYFEHFIYCVNQQAKEVIINYAIQTNGMIITKKWCDFFKDNHFLVGLSIDGSPTYHDFNRLDTRGRGTFNKVLETKRLFEQYHIEYNILCVLTEGLSYHADDVFQFLKDNNIQYAQFIPCLGEIGETNKNSYALTPIGFSRFYHKMLELWIQELQEGNYISIKLDEYRLGYIQEQSLKELLLNKISKKFLYSRNFTDLPPKCDSCPFLNICRGGCKRMKDAMFVDSSQYCGYQEFLNEFIPNIPKIVSLIN